jgi:hypothetical protein
VLIAASVLAGLVGPVGNHLAMRRCHLRRELVAPPLEVVAFDPQGMTRCDQAVADGNVINAVLGERDPRRIRNRQGAIAVCCSSVKSVMWLPFPFVWGGPR